MAITASDWLAAGASGIADLRPLEPLIWLADVLGLLNFVCYNPYGSDCAIIRVEPVLTETWLEICSAITEIIITPTVVFDNLKSKCVS